MNKSFSLVFALIFFVVGAADAQNDPLKINNINSFFEHPFSSGIKSPLILSNNNWSVGSNVMNRNMILTGPNADANEENRKRIENEATKRLGFDFENTLKYIFNYKENEGNDYNYMTLVAGRREIMASLISPDMATLILYGNKSFLGNEKELAYSNLQRISYNSIGIRNTFIKASKGRRIRLEVGLNVLQGNHYLNTSIQKGTMFTDSLGESMSGDFKGDFYESGSSGFSNNGGLGASFDIKYSTTLGGNTAISFELVDAGMIQFKENKKYTIDSTLVYQGIVIDPSSEDPLGFDLKKEYLNEEEVKMLVVVPYTFRVKLHYQLSDLDIIEFGIEAKNLGAFVQQFRASYLRFLGEQGKYALVSGLDVGGFGQYNWRETLHGQVSNTFGFKLGIGGIEGLLFNSLPMNSYLEFGLNVRL
jgi:hypothetical protein